MPRWNKTLEERFEEKVERIRRSRGSLRERARECGVSFKSIRRYGA